MRSILVVLFLALLIDCRTAARGQTFETLFVDNRGQNPAAELVQGSDGAFYGTTENGGQRDWGTIFKMTPEGKVITLVTFDGINGSHPRGRLAKGRDGNFYGTTRYGGRGYDNDGTIFKMTPEGELSTLVTFNGANGRHPYAGLVEGRDGNFYGTTYEGGTNNYGTLFRMTPEGELTTLVSFNGTNGYYPHAGLIEGSDGNLYGTTVSGGVSGGAGTIFKVTPVGDLTTLVSFNGSHGRSPLGTPVEGDDGSFYGTTERGGSNDLGTIFKVTPAGEITTLLSFNGTNGRYPRAGLLKGSDGNFRGTTSGGGAGGFGTIFKVTPAGELTTVVSLDFANGGSSYLTLMEGRDGSLYGTTYNGGTGGDGTLFKVTSAGVFTRLYSFNASYGRNPSAPLVMGNDGNFYGTASEGGANDLGTVFTVTPAGEITTLVSFNGTNGSYPLAELVEGSDGNFYGTTSQGGAYGGLNRYGTIFKVTPAGALTTLVSFEGTNGQTPHGRLLRGSDGNFYGTTRGGGAYGWGTVFKVTPEGVLTTLVSFNKSNGGEPIGGLVEGGDGNFYGTTSEGGSGGDGTVFRITTSGMLTTLVSFNGTNGSTPSGGLVKGSDGNFYGASAGGGANGWGTVFKVTPAGAFTTLSSLSSPNLGRHPIGGLVEGSDGSFYGITSSGGTGGQGTIFRVTPAGVLTTFYSFDGVVSGSSTSTPVFDSDRNLYGTAAQMAVWRISVPMAPGVKTTSPSAIYHKRAILSGTVNANDAEATVVFEYGPTPDYGKSIVATPAKITGTSVTAVSAQVSGLLPGTTYYYRITASNKNGITGTMGASFTTAPNRAPDATNDSFVRFRDTIPLPVLQNDRDPDGDRLTIVAVTQGSNGFVSTDGGTVRYTPGLGFRGSDSFTYTVSDGFDTATAQVELKGDFTRMLFLQGAVIPGAGVEDSGIPAAARFKSFGVPSINSVGKLAFTVNYGVTGGAKEFSILSFDPEAVKSTLVARKGETAPGTEGAIFSSFKEPLLNEAGDIAFVATLSGGDTTKRNDQGIWVSSFTEVSGLGLELIARSGTQPPGVPDGARWKRFTSIAFSTSAGDNAEVDGGWSVAFTAFMSTGTGGVKASNDVGLWIARPEETVLALREGQKLYIGETEKQVRSFAALKALPLAAGQGNGVTGAGAVAVQTFFRDGSQAVLRVSTDAAGGGVAVETLAFSGDAVAGEEETAAKFGLPTQSSSGTVAAWVGTLSGKAKPAAIIERNKDDLKLLARKGNPAPGIDGGRFRAFRSVAVSDSGSALFVGKVTGRGVSKTSDEGLWWRDTNGDNDSLQLLARKGAQPPGVPQGVRWSTFTSLALPEGQYGPLFTAKLVVGSGTERLGKVNRGNDLGLWAVDSSGELRLVVREGDQVIVEGSNTRKTVKSFTVLSAVSGSSAQRRSYDNDGQIVYRAFFTDGSQAVMKTQVP